MSDGFQFSRGLLTAPMVAKALGRSLSWFAKRRIELETEHGFPPPVRGCGTRWDPRALDAWLDQQLQAPPSPEAEAERRMLRRLGADVA